MYESDRKRLLDFKARQDAGLKLTCPKCGKDTMCPDMNRNKPSQYAGGIPIRVCPACADYEARIREMNVPDTGSVTQWAACNPVRPDGDFKAMPGADAKQAIEEKHIPKLLDLYGRWKDGEFDYGEFRYRILETLPGVGSTNNLDSVPFDVRYPVADGQIVVLIREHADEIQWAVDFRPEYHSPED